MSNMRKNDKKRIKNIAIIMFLLIAFLLLTSSIFISSLDDKAYANNNGDGTKGNPFLIDNAEQFIQMFYDTHISEHHYKITSSFELPADYFQQIKKSIYPTLRNVIMDGNNQTISYTIGDPDPNSINSDKRIDITEEKVGLFPYVEKTFAIKNLNVIGEIYQTDIGEMTSRMQSNVGGIIGEVFDDRATNVKIENVSTDIIYTLAIPDTVTQFPSMRYINFGGIIGLDNRSTTIISHCYVKTNLIIEQYNEALYNSRCYFAGVVGGYDMGKRLDAYFQLDNSYIEPSLNYKLFKINSNGSKEFISNNVAANDRLDGLVGKHSDSVNMRAQQVIVNSSNSDSKISLSRDMRWPISNEVYASDYIVRNHKYFKTFRSLSGLVNAVDSAYKDKEDFIKLNKTKGLHISKKAAKNLLLSKGFNADDHIVLNDSAEFEDYAKLFNIKNFSASSKDAVYSNNILTINKDFEPIFNFNRKINFNGAGIILDSSVTLDKKDFSCIFASVIDGGVISNAIFNFEGTLGNKEIKNENFYAGFIGKLSGNGKVENITVNFRGNINVKSNSRYDSFVGGLIAEVDYSKGQPQIINSYVVYEGGNITDYGTNNKNIYMNLDIGVSWVKGTEKLIEVSGIWTIVRYHYLEMVTNMNNNIYDTVVGSIFLEGQADLLNIIYNYESNTYYFKSKDKLNISLSADISNLENSFNLTSGEIPPDSGIAESNDEFLLSDYSSKKVYFAIPIAKVTFVSDVSGDIYSVTDVPLNTEYLFMYDFNILKEDGYYIYAVGANFLDDNLSTKFYINSSTTIIMKHLPIFISNVEKEYDGQNLDIFAYDINSNLLHTEHTIIDGIYNFFDVGIRKISTNIMLNDKIIGQKNFSFNITPKIINVFAKQNQYKVFDNQIIDTTTIVGTTEHEFVDINTRLESITFKVQGEPSINVGTYLIDVATFSIVYGENDKASNYKFVLKSVEYRIITAPFYLELGTVELVYSGEKTFSLSDFKEYLIYNENEEIVDVTITGGFKIDSSNIGTYELLIDDAYINGGGTLIIRSTTIVIKARELIIDVLEGQNKVYSGLKDDFNGAILKKWTRREK